MRAFVHTTWKPLLGLAVVALLLRLVVGGGGPTHVSGAVDRFEAMGFVAATGQDEILKEHGIDLADGKPSTIEDVSSDEAERSDAVEVDDIGSMFGISPTCGCQAARADDWRGVTFAAPVTSIEREGDAEFTEWLVAPSVPGIVSLRNRQARVMPVDVYRYQAGQRLDRNRDHVTSLAVAHMPVLSTAPAKVVSIADVPLGTWIPYPGSAVSVESRSDPELRDRSVVLDELYPTTMGTNATTPAGHEQGYPLGEFLLPSMVAFTGGETEIPGVLRRARSDEVTLLVPRESYAFRIAAIPMTVTDRNRLSRVGEPQGLLPASPLGSLIGRQWFAGRYDRGRVTVEAEDVLTGKAYRQARATVEKHERTTLQFSMLDEIADGAATFEQHEQTFEYPPMPPDAGVNVFGEMRSLRLEGAVGAITVGGRDIALPTPRTVEVTKISRLGTVNGHELVPFLTGPDATGTHFDFSGVGDVEVDGRSQTTFLQRRRSFLDFGVGALGLAASIVGLLEFRWSRQRAERRRPPGRGGRR